MRRNEHHPAAHLAPLRVTYGQRQLVANKRAHAMTKVYVAAERSTGRQVVCTSLAKLEQWLERAKWPGTSKYILVDS
jgi:hypothetical protein